MSNLTDILKPEAQKYTEIPSFIDPEAYSQSSGVPISQVSQAPASAAGSSYVPYSGGGGGSNNLVQQLNDAGVADVGAWIQDHPGARSYWPQSTPENPTPSAGPGNTVVYPSYTSPQYQAPIAQGESGGGGGSGFSGYSQNDAELWNTQLENAYLMQQLGYNVDFQNGEMVYSRSYIPTKYGSYGTYDSGNVVYESDYMRQNPSAYQTPAERVYYPSSGSGYTGYSDYGYYSRSRKPYRNRYYSRYYSNYGQRYNGYGSYGNSSQFYNSNRRYNRYQRSGSYANRYY